MKRRTTTTHISTVSEGGDHVHQSWLDRLPDVIMAMVMRSMLPVRDFVLMFTRVSHSFTNRLIRRPCMYAPETLDFSAYYPQMENVNKFLVHHADWLSKGHVKVLHVHTQMESSWLRCFPRLFHLSLLNLGKVRVSISQLPSSLQELRLVHMPVFKSPGEEETQVKKEEESIDGWQMLNTFLPHLSILHVSRGEYDATVFRFLPRSLTSLHLRLSLGGTEHAHVLCERVPHLVSLQLSGYWGSRRDAEETLPVLAHGLPHLSLLSLPGPFLDVGEEMSPGCFFPSLTTFLGDVSWRSRVPPWLYNSPKLVSLCLKNHATSFVGAHEPLRNTITWRSPLPSLQRLVLDRAEVIHSSDCTLALESLSKTLRSLVVSGPTLSAGLTTWISRLSKLEELQLPPLPRPWMSWDSSVILGMVDFLRDLSHLRTLVLHTDSTDDACDVELLLPSVTRTLPHLERLCFYIRKKPSTIGWEPLQRLPHLSYLTFVDTTSSNDRAEWLEKISDLLPQVQRFYLMRYAVPYALELQRGGRVELKHTPHFVSPYSLLTPTDLRLASSPFDVYFPSLGSQLTLYQS